MSKERNVFEVRHQKEFMKGEYRKPICVCKVCKQEVK